MQHHQPYIAITTVDVQKWSNLVMCASVLAFIGAVFSIVGPLVQGVGIQWSNIVSAVFYFVVALLGVLASSQKKENAAMAFWILLTIHLVFSFTVAIIALVTKDKVIDDLCKDINDKRGCDFAKDYLSVVLIVGMVLNVLCIGSCILCGYKLHKSLREVRMSTFSPTTAFATAETYPQNYYYPAAQPAHGQVYQQPPQGYMPASRP